MELRQYGSRKGEEQEQSRVRGGTWGNEEAGDVRINQNKGMQKPYGNLSHCKSIKIVKKLEDLYHIWLDDATSKSNVFFFISQIYFF